MKKFLLSFFTVFLTFQMFAQLNIRIGSHEPVRSNSSWNVPINNFASVAEGQAIIADILEAVNRKANFEIRSTNSVPNAAAVNYGGRRYVLYNPNFINSLDRASGNRWASISVLAHEVGHHLEGHTETGEGSNPTIELEADEFSGYALRKMGASLAEAQSAMQLIASERTSTTHPGKQNRLAAIENGWKMAGREEGEVIASRNPAPNPRETTRRSPEPTSRETSGQNRTGTQTRKQQSSISLGNILIGIFGQVFGGNVRNGGFVVNETSNVMQRVNNNWFQIGKLTKMNNSRYPYVISGNRGVQMYVDQKGNIFNTSGKVLGLLQSLRYG
jgi:hypothetical protein